MSLAFGAVRKSVFLDRELNLAIKKIVYQACVLSVLLYGSECWTLLKRHSRRLDTGVSELFLVSATTNSGPIKSPRTNCARSGRTKRQPQRGLQNKDCSGWAYQTAEYQRRSSLDGSVNHDHDVAPRRDGGTQYMMI